MFKAASRVILLMDVTFESHWSREKRFSVGRQGTVYAVGSIECGASAAP